MNTNMTRLITHTITQLKNNFLPQNNGFAMSLVSRGGYYFTKLPIYSVFEIQITIKHLLNERAERAPARACVRVCARVRVRVCMQIS